MNPVKMIRNLFKKKVVDLSLGLEDGAWRSVGGMMDFYRRNDMENGYASIRVIVNNFAKIEPYTIDAKGKSVKSNVLDRLYTPNTSMSAYDFREALAVMSLVHDKVRIRVHHGETNAINDKTITGFTFLEGETETIAAGKRSYHLMNGENLDDTEVITLLNINPYDVDAGFSAAAAAKRWTTLDDYIADYQKGFFENGAVPSGQLIITAKTATEFNDQVDMLKARHRGAAHSGNITYTHRPLDQLGKAQVAGIEWQPFASSNKDLALQALFDNVNKKIDSAYGVPASLRGVNDQNTYASVKVDQRILIDNVIQPLILKVWGKFTHELNRITGGVGVAITADADEPDIADEELAVAQTKEVEMGIINTMFLSGFTIDTIVDAFQLDDSYKSLKEKVKPEVVENPVVVSGTDLKDTPDQPIDQFTKKTEPKKKILDPVDKAIYIHKLSGIVKDQMQRQVTSAIEKLPDVVKSKAYGDVTTEEDEKFTAEMLALMATLVTIYGNKTNNLGIALILKAGLSTENITTFALTDAQKALYSDYIAKVGVGYGEQTAVQIRDILEQGITSGATKNELENQLKDVILGKDNEYRVTRLANTEVNLAEGRGSVSAMQNIAEQTGYTVNKVWVTGGAEPCEYCQALDGERVAVDGNFVDLGAEIHGVDGGTFFNDFSDTDTADAHPNCECYTTYEIEGA